MAYDFRYWSYLYADKKPIGRERPFHLLGEQLIDPEEQGKRLRSCFYHKDQAKINKLQTVFPLDRIGRKIFFGVDRVICLTANQHPLLIWNPLYQKGQTIVMQCIIPGYTQYRCMKKAKELLVISDQIMANEVRDQEQYELVALTRNSTGFAVKDSFHTSKGSHL